MDGYLYNAEVFIDLDGDGEKDADEFSTVTDENGSYTLPVTLMTQQHIVLLLELFQGKQLIKMILQPQ